MTQTAWLRSGRGLCRSMPFWISSSTATSRSWTSSTSRCRRWKSWDDRRLSRTLDDLRRIFRLRRQLRRFDRIIGPMEAVCDRGLSGMSWRCVDPSARVWFRDVLDHVRGVLWRWSAGLPKDTLASIVETPQACSSSSVRGGMTRQLAAWAAILAVPTAIAGIYGMNFDIMPELRWRYGYFGGVGRDRRDLHASLPQLPPPALALAEQPSAGERLRSNREQPRRACECRPTGRYSQADRRHGIHSHDGNLRPPLTVGSRLTCRN